MKNSIFLTVLYLFLFLGGFAITRFQLRPSAIYLLKGNVVVVCILLFGIGFATACYFDPNATSNFTIGYKQGFLGFLFLGIGEFVGWLLRKVVESRPPA